MKRELEKIREEYLIVNDYSCLKVLISDQEKEGEQSESSI